MKTKLAVLAALLAVFASSFTPTQAGSAYNPSSGGCAGWGLSYVIDVDYSYSKTDSAQTGGCAHAYSLGYFYDGSTYVPSGPGWVNGSIALSEWYDTAYAVSGYHKLCNSTPDCGNLWLSTAP